MANNAKRSHDVADFDVPETHLGFKDYFLPIVKPRIRYVDASSDAAPKRRKAIHPVADHEGVMQDGSHFVAHAAVLVTDPRHELEGHQVSDAQDEFESEYDEPEDYQFGDGLLLKLKMTELPADGPSVDDRWDLITGETELFERRHRSELDLKRRLGKKSVDAADVDNDYDDGDDYWDAECSDNEFIVDDRDEADEDWTEGQDDSKMVTKNLVTQVKSKSKKSFMKLGVREGSKGWHRDYSCRR